ncbi:MAG: hypothetical protein ACWGO1_10855 [Anaerolineales bacterium]
MSNQGERITTKSMNNGLLRLARPLAFLLGIALSLLAIYSFAYTAWRVIVDPALVLPEADIWTAVEVEKALSDLGLSGYFYAAYTLAITLLFGLSFLACGWLVLLRRSRDWFGIYLALLMLVWASGVGVFSSMPTSPWLDNTYLGWFMWPGLFFLLYLFPSGHVVPRWARWFAWVWILFSLLMFATDILGVLPENFLIFLPVILSVLLVGGYAQVYRYRHAAAIERQQIKLVVSSFVLFAIFFVFFALAINFTGLVDPGVRSPTNALVINIILATGAHLVFMSVPVSITLAMLRYRLWDVDIVIRRTLVYGGLTATLGLVYFGSIILLQGLFEALSGQRSAVAVVISTLVIAALFNPLRRRIQNDIDRRFFRRKYDAERVVDAFSAGLREEVDLEDLQAQIVSVVQETLQPEMVSLWLKGTERKL